MSELSGPFTIDSTGVKTIYIGVSANDITFMPDGSESFGFADHLFQFSRNGANYSHTKQVFYDTSGLKLVEFTVTGWGSTTFTINVTWFGGVNVTIPIIIRT